LAGFKANPFCNNQPCAIGSETGLGARNIVRIDGLGKRDMELYVIGILTLEDIMSGNNAIYGTDIDSKK
jgi:hypothetical protein